jgi:hypothetical protein
VADMRDGAARHQRLARDAAHEVVRRAAIRRGRQAVRPRRVGGRDRDGGARCESLSEVAARLVDRVREREVPEREGRGVEREPCCREELVGAAGLLGRDRLELTLPAASEPDDRSRRRRRVVPARARCE